MYNDIRMFFHKVGGHIVDVLFGIGGLRHGEKADLYFIRSCSVSAVRTADSENMRNDTSASDNHQEFFHTGYLL